MNDTTRDEPIPGVELYIETVIADNDAKHFQLRCLIGTQSFTICQPREDRLDAVSLRRTFADALRSVRRAACSSLPDGPVAERAELLERALAELVDKIVPGLDSGDLLADAKAASAALAAPSAQPPVEGGHQ